MPRKKTVVAKAAGGCTPPALSVSTRSSADAPPAAPAVPLTPRARPRDVRDMNRQELEDHARELTMAPKYLQLSDDRLRQNIQAFLMHTRGD